MRYRRIWRALGLGGAVLVASVFPAANAMASSQVVTKRVSIVNSGGTCTSLFCFQPSALTITSGQRVKWTNTTTAPHTVTRCTPTACSGQSGGTGSDPAPNSPTLGANGTYAHTFHGKGTYLYYCQIHGFAVMHATVTVN